MNYWRPIWQTITESSVWEEPYYVRLLWVTMIASQDADHVVRANSYQLHRRANIPLDEVEAALRVLSEPDKRRPGQDEEGRRIRKMGEGEWFLINGAKYAEAMRRMNRKAYKAEKEREYRLKKKNGGPGATVRERVFESAERVGDRRGADLATGTVDPKDLENARAIENAKLALQRRETL